MAIAKAKGQKAKADKLCSYIVRSRGACESCGGTRWLQPAHIVSRSYSATRCAIDNIFCLDAACHLRFTKWPLEFAEFVENKIGREAYLSLRARAKNAVGQKAWDWNKDIEKLKAYAEENGIDLSALK